MAIDLRRVRVGAARRWRTPRCSPTCTSSRWPPPSSAKAWAGRPPSACSCGGCRRAAGSWWPPGWRTCSSTCAAFRFSDTARWTTSARWAGSSPPSSTHLRGLRFTGEVRAVPEGTRGLRRRAAAGGDRRRSSRPSCSRPRCSTSATCRRCSRARPPRSVLAADGRTLAEFGLRRSHGIDAGMKAARAALLAGFDSTSNVLAGLHLGRAALGHDGALVRDGVSRREVDAFRAYARAFPDERGAAARHLRHGGGGAQGGRGGARARGRGATGWPACGSTAATSPR